jgi:hypothetical protein
MDRRPFNRDRNWLDKRRDFFLKENNLDLLARQILKKRRLERFLMYCASQVDIELKKVSIEKVSQVEVFFDIFCDGKRVCYLLKQWNSSILCLGDTIELRREDFKGFKERFSKIYHICAVNYITILFPANKKDSSSQILLETPIYLDNFNERVLEKAVNRFRKCKELLRPLLGNKL